MEQSNQRELLLEWYRRIVLSSQSHYNTAQRYQRLHLAIGVPVVILSAVAATFTFASLESETDPLFKILLGLVSMFAAMLASLQTFLGISQRAERHSAFGARYGNLRREIEKLLEIPLSEDAFNLAIQNLQTQLNMYSEQAPPIPSKVWFKTEDRYKDRFKSQFPTTN